MKALSPLVSDLKSQYQNRDLAIGIRFEDRCVDKITTTAANLLKTVWSLLDNKHPICREYKHTVIVSIFICNDRGTTLYDSRDYVPNRQKIILKRDGDRKVINFKTLSQEDREEVVNKMLTEMSGEKSSGQQKPNSDKKNSSWGDLPWDFN